MVFGGRLWVSAPAAVCDAIMLEDVEEGVSETELVSTVAAEVDKTCDDERAVDAVLVVAIGLVEAIVLEEVELEAVIVRAV